MDPARFDIRRRLHRSRRLALARWLLLAALAGALAGVAAMLFHLGVDALSRLLLADLAGQTLPLPGGEGLLGEASGVPRPVRPWLLPLMAGGVGLLTGLLSRRFLPRGLASGVDGTDAMILAYHQEDGAIAPPTTLLRGGTAVLTLASGASAGQEGPITLLGASMGSWLARWLDLSGRERRLLLLAGAAGGLGAIFHAPLGGALTAIEIVYLEDFEAEALLPAIVAAVVGYLVFGLLFGAAPMLAVPEFHHTRFTEYPLFLGVAGLCWLGAWLHLRCFRACKEGVFLPLARRVGLPATACLGGLLAGSLAMLAPQTMGGGFGWMEEAVLGRLDLAIMLAAILAKMLATACTVGSGMSGGMFAPALLLGGLWGGVAGQLTHWAFPVTAPEPGIYVLLGAATFFAGISRSAIGPVILLCELTQGYGLLAPLLFTVSAGMLCMRGLRLYDNQVASRAASPSHRAQAMAGVLEGVLTRDCFQPGPVTILEEGMPMEAMIRAVRDTGQTVFPTRDGQGRLVRLLTLHDMRWAMLEETLRTLAVVHDLPGRPMASLGPHEDGHVALLRFMELDVSELPVIDPGHPGQVLGMLRRKDLLRAFHRAMAGGI